jgi:hypothetical protein
MLGSHLSQPLIFGPSLRQHNINFTNIPPLQVASLEKENNISDKPQFGKIWDGGSHGDALKNLQK